MHFPIFVLFMTFGSSFGAISITLTEVASIPLPVGQEIHFGEYKWLGAGAFGTIVLVNYDMGGFKKDLVLKQVSKTERNLLEIQHEYRILQVLKGKATGLRPGGIINAYGYGTYSGDDEGYVLVLQYVCSPNLNALGFDFNASTQEILSTGLDLIKILQVVHNAGVVHLDIKALNLLYALQQLNLGLVLIDWGSAKLISSHMSGPCGTVAFMSPNVAKGGVYGPDDDLRSVMYVLGKAGFKGKLHWEITSVFSAFFLLLGDDVNTQKEHFENNLASQKLDQGLIDALTGIKQYLQSGSSRVPGQINYKPICDAFLQAISEVATRKDNSWTSQLMDIFSKFTQAQDIE